MFLVYTSELCFWYIPVSYVSGSELCFSEHLPLENTLVTYADDSILLATVPSPAERVNMGESLNRDLTSISEGCMRWGMLMDA